MQWIDVLKREVSKQGLGAVADMMETSRAAVSQLVNGKYPGNLSRMQARVEGVFFNRTVECPVAGEIPAQQCFSNQRKKPGSNPMNLRFFKACRSGCPHSQQKQQFGGEVIPTLYVSTDEPQEYNPHRTLHLLKTQATSQEDSSKDAQLTYIQLLESEVHNLAARLKTANKGE